MEPTFRSGTTVLGKYRIEDALGREGMYMALRVSHPQLGELVLKMLLPETAISLSVHARFVREAQAAQRLRSEHVARLIDVGISSDGVPYLVTEAVRGVELGAELARRGALLPAEAIDYGLQVCDALAEAHAHGIVHRRVRPASVLLTARPDGSLLIKLLDFGVVRPSAASTPGTAVDALPRPVPGADAVAETAYTAPELIRWPDDVDGRADIWSVGAVLYECLTGQRPFPEPASASGRIAVSGAPPPMDPQIPPGLQAAVLRCLEPDREARFPSIAALAAALAPYAHDHRMAGFLVDRAHRFAQGIHHADPVAAAGPDPFPAPAMLAPEVAPDRARRRYRTIAVVALCVSLGGIATVALVRPGRSHAQSPASAAKPVAGSASGAPGPTAPDPAAAATRPTAAAPTAAAPTAAAPTAAAPTAAAPAAASESKSEDERAAKLTACAELQRAQRWQDLEACASALAALGASGKAEELRATARQEIQNELLDRQARRALRSGNLAQARAALQQIDPGSAYLAPLRDAFAAAEQQRTDEAHRRAQQLAGAHDCAGLRRLIAQLTASSTERVVAAALDVTCRDDAPAEHARTALPPERAARPSTPPAAEHAVRPRKGSCDSVDVSELMTRAATEYDAGSPSAALSLARIALGCKQTDRMYWLAVMYACAAHDAASARQYFTHVPANLQAGIERKCQQDHLDVRTR
jgi:serine/threonine-protein kinase